MKGTARALFAVAMRHRMCYEIICDHVHNIVDHVHNRVDHVHNSVDHVYNSNHMHNLVQCVLGYLNLDYPNPHLFELTKACKFHKFQCNLQDGGHLVM